ncbi:MAG: glycosyltransferase 87 family protein [Chloroflexota bacterium]
MRDARRWAGAYAVVTGILAAVFAIAILAGPYRAVERSDYMTYQTAARIVLQGRGGCLYTEACQLQAQRDLIGDEPSFEEGVLPFNSPPWLPALLAPVGLLPLRLAFATFTLVSLALLALATWRLAWGGRPTRLLATLILLSAWPTVMGGIRGQSTLSAAALLGLSAAASVGGRRGRAGVHLGLAAIKPTLPIIWAVRLVVERQWRALAVAAAAVLGLVLLAVVVVSPTAVTEYPQYLLNLAGGDVSAGVHVDEMINWRGAAVRLGAENTPLAIAGVIGTLALVAAAWWWARRSPRAPALGAGVAFTATPLVIWHANQHEAVLAMLGILVAIAALEELRVPLATVAISLQSLLWIGPALTGAGSAWLLFLILLASLGGLAVLSWREGARYFSPVSVPTGNG